MKWYVKVLRQYVDFRGRASRTELWMFTLISTVIGNVLLAVDHGLGLVLAGPGYSLGALSGVYALVIMIPGLAVAVRRLHDTNRSGWWYLIGFTVVGLVVLIVFWVLEGTRGPNAYGPDPRDEARADPPVAAPGYAPTSYSTGQYAPNAYGQITYPASAPTALSAPVATSAANPAMFPHADSTSTSSAGLESWVLVPSTTAGIGYGLYALAAGIDAIDSIMSAWVNPLPGAVVLSAVPSALAVAAAVLAVFSLMRTISIDSVVLLVVAALDGVADFFNAASNESESFQQAALEVGLVTSAIVSVGLLVCILVSFLLRTEKSVALRLVQSFVVLNFLSDVVYVVYSAFGLLSTQSEELLNGWAIANGILLLPVAVLAAGIGVTWLLPKGSTAVR